MKPARTKAAGEEGLRQSMSWLHTWSGLIFGWVLFAMFLTGTLAFFRPEITRWMQPEIDVAPVSAEQASAVAQRYLQAHAPDARRWFVTLPTQRAPAIQLSYPAVKPKPGERGFTRVSLDPATGDALHARQTRGGDFFYRFHFELEMAFPWGRWLASIAGMFMLVAIISGIITHKKIFTDFFTFRPRKGGQRAWMDGHNVLSVLGLPFHLMITFSGLVIFMYMLMPAGVLAAYDNERAFFDEMFPAFTQTALQASPAPLAPLAGLVARARAEWDGGRPGRIVVNNPGDASATVSVTRSTSERIAYGRMAPTITFDGVTGQLRSQDAKESAVAATAGTIVGLHLGLFAEPVLRWLYFLVSLAGTAMVGTGLALWIAKRRQKAAGRESFALRLVDALNAGSIAGLCVAVAAFFWANRLLPPALPQHAQWEVRIFFGAWLLCGLYAAVARRRKWRDLLALAAFMAAALPVLNLWTTQRHLGVSLPAGDWVMAGFDLTALACAALLGWMAWRAARKAAAAAVPPRARPAPASRRAPARDAAAAAIGETR
ncbi:PepSY-associated TM helix domain-containing protein [Bordetella bronchiseptica]|uniref:PepSY-associated TM helix domain-containing protein n=1 Tax=Bordetella bronchiseptica TaxID=518 RepID=UPI000460CF1C|nr:PepSY-associated TM helix domain-containing protein [Bordetella bronchiseptica]KDD15290.1 PepSY domain protein [Bordetella bronchiseptica MBORD707]